jgi:SET domain-containing protein
MDDGEYFVAARDIKTGEELTADYREYHETTSFKT